MCLYESYAVIIHGFAAQRSRRQCRIRIPLWGVDYAGPMRVRILGGRGIRAYPANVAVFACFAAKVIHLEFITNY